MKKTILFLGGFLFLMGCSKDCSWEKALLSGQTYKPTKYEQNGADVTTSLTQLDPCVMNSVKFNSDGTFTTINASGCNGSNDNGTWATQVSNGKNYLVLDGANTEVLSFDCNNIVLNGTTGGVTLKATFTKQ